MQTLARLTAVCWIFSLAPAFAQSPAKQALAYLQSLENHGWSGTVLIEHRKKQILLEGFGFANREDGVRCGPETLYEIASATKPITAVTVLALVEEGKLELDDSIAEHLPGVPEQHADITVEQLLAHTSGMPRNAAGGHGDDLKVAVEAYFAKPKATKPGTHTYWNGGYALLAGIIEQVTGKTYMQAVEQHVFQPAKMKSSGFAGDEFPAEQQAVGYGRKRTRLAADHAYQGSYGWHYRGMGGAVCTAADLLAFVKATGSAKLLKRKTVRRMWTPVGEHYGLGWGIASNTATGEQRIGHGGDVDGFHTALQHFPKSGNTIVVLTNIEGLPAWKVSWNLEAILFGEDLPYGAPPEGKPWKQSAIEALAGDYTLTAGGRVRIEPYARGVRLLPLDLTSTLRLEPSGNAREVLAQAERMQELLDAVIAGDGDLLANSVGGNAPASWGRRVAVEIWPQHLRENGELQRTVLSNAKMHSNGRIEFWYRLEHKDQASYLKTVTHEGRLTYFSLAPDDFPEPTIVHLAPGPKARQLVGYDLGAGNITVEATPNKSGIELRFASGLELQLVAED